MGVRHLCSVGCPLHECLLAVGPKHRTATHPITAPLYMQLWPQHLRAELRVKLTTKTLPYGTLKRLLFEIVETRGSLTILQISGDVGFSEGKKKEPISDRKADARQIR